MREVLDLNDEGESIFDRKKQLVEASLSRVHAGLVKFVAGGRDAFLVKYNSMSQRGKYIAPGIDDPCPTVATQNRLAVAKVNFIQQRHGGNPNSKIVSIEQPARTLTSTGGNMDVVSAKFLCKHFGGRPEGKSVSVEGPAGAITTRDHHAFVSAYYGNGFNSSIERPAPTVTTKDRFQLVRPFFVNYYSGGGQTAGTDDPAPAVMTNPKQRLVTPWVMNTSFNNIGCSLDVPAQTVTANRKWHYLVNPQFASAGAPTDRPCFTLIARMDKRPPQLVTVETDGRSLPSFIRRQGGALVYEIYGDDTPMMVQIKEFMALYGLVDIKMRMLRIRELKRIMGFPENYVLVGTQGEQKKFIGNAVEVNMARVLCEALVRKLYELNITPQTVAA
jgi:DNA (cytosine-5)-methyltransferase 1